MLPAAYSGANIPVLLIHGAATPGGGNSTMAAGCATSVKTHTWFELEAGGDGCEWAALRRFLDQRTLNGAHFQSITEGYFYNDSNMDDYIDYSGDPGLCYGARYYGAGNDGQQAAADGRPSHNANADIRHLSYQLAWRIHDRFGDQPVSIVADSMGGLVVRGMLYGAGGGRYPDQDPSCAYPSALNVPTVVTLSTPNDGAAPAYAGCHLAPNPREFCQLVGNDRHNAFLWTLDHTDGGLNPQGAGGTDWTVMGSASDPMVPPASAIHLGSRSGLVHQVVFYSASTSCHPRLVNGCAYPHGGLKQDTRSSLDTVVWVGSSRRSGAPHPGEWIFEALSRGNRVTGGSATVTTPSDPRHYALLAR
ncbi:MAG TPA: hypothetical protein VNV65_12170 [Candidatus Solibacter sp.]|nr:hypothetical protein [Candidatus Solibacter sp.]